MFVTLGDLARFYLNQLLLQHRDFPIVFRRISSFFLPFHLLFLLLLLLGVSVVQDVVVVQVVAVLRGVARLEEHRQQVVPLVLGVLHGEAGGGVLQTDARQELHEEWSVEVFTQLVHYKPKKNTFSTKYKRKCF